MSPGLNVKWSSTPNVPVSPVAMATVFENGGPVGQLPDPPVPVVTVQPGFSPSLLTPSTKGWWTNPPGAPTVTVPSVPTSRLLESVTEPEWLVTSVVYGP